MSASNDTAKRAIVALNAGSSSVKFACFRADDLTVLVNGQADGIGVRPVLTMAESGRKNRRDLPPAADHAEVLRHVLTDVIVPRVGSPEAVGHRVVHGGGRFDSPERVDDAVLAEIETFSPLARAHQPHNVAGIRAAMAVWPDTAQVACFDTAFHATLPEERQVFAIPRALTDAGLRRYGFHGLSYEGVARVLPDLIGEAARGTVVAAHLGNGASLCAMVDLQSRWTSMGFTPLDGLVMGRRPGRLDPGILVWLMREKGMDADALDVMLNRECGLMGLSGLSPDMRDLTESDDPGAGLAIDVFIDRLVTEIGSAAAAIGGCDALVFTGGIGENAGEIRRRTVDRLAFLGFEPLPVTGDNGVISSVGAKPVVIVRADEERTIAAACRRIVEGR